MFVERMVQVINPGKWGELEDLEKRYNALESKYGFPPKRRMRAIFGGLTVNTLIVEREWDSMAALETATMQRMVDPNYPALDAAANEVIESVTWEIYMSLP